MDPAVAAAKQGLAAAQSQEREAREAAKRERENRDKQRATFSRAFYQYIKQHPDGKFAASQNPALRSVSKSMSEDKIAQLVSELSMVNAGIHASHQQRVLSFLDELIVMAGEHKDENAAVLQRHFGSIGKALEAFFNEVVSQRMVPTDRGSAQLPWCSALEGNPYCNKGFYLRDSVTKDSTLEAKKAAELAAEDGDEFAFTVKPGVFAKQGVATRPFDEAFPIGRFEEAVSAPLTYRASRRRRSRLSSGGRKKRRSSSGKKRRYRRR